MRLFITILAATLFGVLEVYSQETYTQEGTASYYGRELHGRRTSSGERFSKHKLTAAHPTLAFGTMVKVTNLDNGKSVTVRINDRGPSTKKRIIDVSYAAAKKLGMVATGTAQVRIEALKEEVDPAIPVSEPESEDTPRELYQLDVKLAETKGWAVQLGSFGEAGNLMQMANTIRQTYNKPILVDVATNSEKKVYRLLVGPEKSEESATALLMLVKKDYPDAFVTKL
jgi:rare lipoprotein A